MSNVTLLGVPNHVTDETNTLTAASVASSDTSVENLRDSRLGRVWRSLYATNASTWIRMQMASGNYRAMGGVAIGGTNLTKSTISSSTGARTATGRFRVRASDLDFKPRRNPDAIAAKSANLTGTVAGTQNLDPEQPGATWITCSDNLANDIRYTFPTFGGMTLDGTTNAQTFRCVVRRKASGGTNPTAEIELWENGSLVTSLVSGVEITETTFQVLTATFTAGSLSNTTAANLEVKVVITAGDSTTAEHNGAYTEAVLNFTSGGASSVWYDSGWITPTLPSALVPPFNLYHVFPSSIVPTYVQVDFDSDDNDDGYIEAGVWIAGPTFQPFVNVEPGAGWMMVDPSILSRTIGSAKFFEARKKYRVFEGNLPLLSETEAIDTFLDRIDRQLGLVGQFALIFDPEDTGQFHNTAAIGRLASLEPLPFIDSHMNVSRRLRFEEDVA